MAYSCRAGGRQATQVGGPVRQPYAIVDNIPQLETKNLATE